MRRRLEKVIQFATYVFSAYLVQNMSDLDQKHLQNKSQISDTYRKFTTYYVL